MPGAKQRRRRPTSKQRPLPTLTPHSDAPTRTRSARVRCFRLFSFTSSPFGDKNLWYKGLSVKVSPNLPSPVKAKNAQSLTHILQIINQLEVKVKGEGKNCELAECAMRGRVSAEAHLHTRENGEGNTTEGGEEDSRREEEKQGRRMGRKQACCSKKMGGKKEKKTSFARKSTSFHFQVVSSRKNKTFSRKNYGYSKQKVYLCA